MSLIRISEPDPLVSLALAKQHLRVDHDEEDELIGFYLSSHPLASYERSLQRLKVSRAADLPALLQRGVPGRIKLAGTVIDRQERTSAKGNRFAFDAHVLDALHPRTEPAWRERYEFATVEKRGRVLEVTLNRPEVHNALDVEMGEQLIATLKN